MKTLIIFSSQEDLAKFYIVNGDKSRFEGVAIGVNDDEIEGELNEFISSIDEKKLDEFPVDQQPFDQVVNCGSAAF